MKNSIPTFTAKRKPDTIPAAISAEMQRLAKIHPLLSPTLGWPKVKGVQFVQSSLNLPFITKVNVDVVYANPVWGYSQDAELRKEADRAVRGIVGEIAKFAGRSLKSAGWKLKVAEQRTSRAIATLWTRQGQEVAILGYMDAKMPLGTWEDNSPKAYSGNSHIVIAAAKTSRKGLQEVLSLLDAQMGKMRKQRSLIVPYELGFNSYDLPQLHFSRYSREEKLPSQYAQLVKALRGKVCFVEFRNEHPHLPEAQAHILNSEPNTGWLSKEAWTSACQLAPGQVRLVAMRYGSVKWSETFGRDEKVPAAVLKRLITESKPENFAPSLEQQALYLGVAPN